MTASITNSISEICSICRLDLTDRKKAETEKVIELAYKHLFHTSYFAFWFHHKRENFIRLTCDNCTQFSTVSNEYVEQKMAFYLRERLINFPLFDGHLEQLERDYSYDDQVLKAIPQ